VATAIATAAPAPGSAAAAAPRYACLETATEAELRVDLGGGEGGAWRGDLTLTILGGGGELAGTVFDMAKVTAKGRKPPKLKLKAKEISEAQLKDILRGLTDAVTKAEEGMDCDSPVPHSAKLSWSCANGAIKTGGEQSFEGDRCGKAKGYARAVGISDWAVAALKRHGGR
jgi:hypothetical protein